MRSIDERSLGELYRALLQLIGHENTDTLMSLLPAGDGPPSRDDLRQLETRVDARFQAVNARFATVDRRFASMVHRIDEIEHASKALPDRFDHRIRSLEGRLDATDARIDLVNDKVALRLDRSERHFARLLVGGMAGSTLAATAIYVGSLAIVI